MKLQKKHIETILIAALLSALILLVIFFYIQEKAKKSNLLDTIANLTPIYTSLESPKDIVDINSTEVKAVIYTNTISLADLPIKQKKKKFIEMLLPSILVAKYRLEEIREQVVDLRALPEHTPQQKKFLAALFKTYKTEDFDKLLSKLSTHPNSIVLAQAAVESGWGSSRFFLEANNIFGIWSFNKREKRIPALGKRGDKTIYVRKYDSLEESIRDYFQTVGTSSAFKNFRANRLVHKDPMKLIEDLQYYSELREEYVKKLERVISYNNFKRFDDYQLSKESFQANSY